MYLFIRKAVTERGENLPSLVHFPNAYNRQDEARSFIQVRVQGPEHLGHLLLLFPVISRELDHQWSSKDMKNARIGCWHDR